MLFSFYCEDIPDSLEKRLAAREAHLGNIGALNDQGRVYAAGPFPKVPGGKPAEVGFDGSLIIADFDSLEEAQAWIDADPYVTAGVFAKVTVRPWVQVFPAK